MRKCSLFAVSTLVLSSCFSLLAESPEPVLTITPAQIGDPLLDETGPVTELQLLDSIRQHFWIATVILVFVGGNIFGILLWQRFHV